MFETSISGGLTPDPAPYVVYGTEIPSKKIPLMDGQNLVQGSRVLRFKSSGVRV
jgi:hypothetical protein